MLEQHGLSNLISRFPKGEIYARCESITEKQRKSIVETLVQSRKKLRGGK